MKVTKDVLIEALNRLDEWASYTTEGNDNGEAEEQGRDYNMLFDFILQSDVYDEGAEQKQFQIVSVCRADLQGIGFDTSNVSDETMQNVARRMGEAYLENGYWQDLKELAKYLEIPKSKEYDRN